MRTKKFDLDDIGHIGGDRPYTDEDAHIVSAFIQSRKDAKRKPKRTVAKSKSPSKAGKAAVRCTAKRNTKAKSRVA